MEQSPHPSGARLVSLAQPRPQWKSVTPKLIAIDFCVTWAMASLIGQIHHIIRFGDPTEFVWHIRFGLAFSLVFCGISVAMRAYEADRYAATLGNTRQMALAWLSTCALVLFFFFMVRFSGNFSRGYFLTLLGLGGLVLLTTRLVTIRWLRGEIDAGNLVTRRALLIGADVDIAAYLQDRRKGDGVEIAGTYALRYGSGETLSSQRLDELEHIVRQIAPDDVIVIGTWEQTARIGQIASQLMSLPAAVHLVPHQTLADFAHLAVGQVGARRLVTVVPQPLAPGEIVIKRIFDVAAATAALVLLLPSFALIAAAILLEGGGPVLFRQIRHGFNRETFELLKFRTLAPASKNDPFRQVTRGDPRVTRVGRFLRRYNLDELPQLINVLKGDMSLVGPRPHPLQLDFDSDGKFGHYSRRYNIRPGMTGWAQVNGLRGETDTPGKMQSRLECDLYYIDNWSIWFDLQIMLLTVLSPRAFRNAM